MSKLVETENKDFNESVVYRTQDYDKFVSYKSNREVGENHVKKMVRKIRLANHLDSHPISVNSNFNVIDGQHRLEAARRLNLPIYYIINDRFTVETLACVNSASKNWAPPDYLHHFLVEGNKEYKKLDDFMKDMNFPISTALCWINELTYGSPASQLKAGTLVLDITNALREAAKFTSELVAIMVATNHKCKAIKGNQKFHYAAKKVFTNPLVDRNAWLQNYHMQSYNLIAQPNTRSYVDMLLNIYNYNKRNRLILDVNGNILVSYQGVRNV